MTNYTVSLTIGVWDFIHKTDCRGYVHPNSVKISANLMSNCMDRMLENNDRINHTIPPNTTIRARICREGLATQQTLGFIDSAAAPLGLR